MEQRHPPAAVLWVQPGELGTLLQTSEAPQSTVVGSAEKTKQEIPEQRQHQEHTLLSSKEHFLLSFGSSYHVLSYLVPRHPLSPAKRKGLGLCQEVLHQVLQQPYGCMVAGVLFLLKTNSVMMGTSFASSKGLILHPPSSFPSFQETFLTLPAPRCTFLPPQPHQGRSDSAAPFWSRTMEPLAERRIAVLRSPNLQGK